MPTNLTSKLKFLERHQLLKHAQESLNSPVSIKEIEFVVKRPQGRKLHIKMASLFNSAIYFYGSQELFLPFLRLNVTFINIIIEMKSYPKEALKIKKLITLSSVY